MEGGTGVVVDDLASLLEDRVEGILFSLVDNSESMLVIKDLDALFEGDDAQTCLTSLLNRETVISITTGAHIHSSTNAGSYFEPPSVSCNDLGGQSRDYASVFNSSDDDGTSGERRPRNDSKGLAQKAAMEAQARILLEHGAEHEICILNEKHKHGLPIARVKRMMKEHSCHSCNPVAVNLPDLVARTVELFVLDVCAQGAAAALQRGRNVVQVRDLKTVLDAAPHYSFLQDVYDECIKH
ncbi:hypothetical protein T492DRAFT_963786 [Pavlovales sp. CCMP2436]|nr:hypothetical protein T492DRAFT_963786 [Pavlovales sp. CCMP2436]